MSDLEIREQLARYIAHEVDRASLQSWLEEVAWDASGPPAASLAADAIRLLAERSHGDWTDEELGDRLATLSRTYWLERAPKLSYANSGSHVIQEDRQSASVERWRAAESV